MAGTRCLKRMILPVLLTALLLSPACNLFKKNRENVRRFAAEFEAIQARYVQEPDVSLLLPEQSSALKEKAGELNVLLKKYEVLLPSGDDEAELLKSKVLLEMSDYKEARQKIDALISGESSVAGDAQMLKVLLLVRAGAGGRALRLFRQIEASVPAGPFLYDAWLHFALYGDDESLEIFGKKVLETQELPEKFQKYKSFVYRRLAAHARRQGNLEQAGAMLEKAVQSAPGEEMIALAQSESARLEFIGKPAVALEAETWLNSTRLSLAVLRGKPVVVVFWAPWCNLSHRLLPELQRVYEALEKKGLVVIGYTRLYGFFREGSPVAGPLNRQDELAAIKKYIEENRLTFPVAVSDEGYGFENYNVTALPTFVLIGKNGNVIDTVTGTGRFQTLEKEIKQLLEER